METNKIIKKKKAEKRDLPGLFNIADDESRKEWMEGNCKKTEMVIVSEDQTPPECDIYIYGTKFEQRPQYKYLATFTKSHGRNKKKKTNKQNIWDHTTHATRTHTHTHKELKNLQRM